jgi:hypothetical protein
MESPVRTHIEIVGDWEREPDHGGNFHIAPEDRPFILRLRCKTCGHEGFLIQHINAPDGSATQRTFLRLAREHAEQQACPVCVHAERTGQTL